MRARERATRPTPTEQQQVGQEVRAAASNERKRREKRRAEEEEDLIALTPLGITQRPSTSDI